MSNAQKARLNIEQLYNDCSKNVNDERISNQLGMLYLTNKAAYNAANNWLNERIKFAQRMAIYKAGKQLTNDCVVFYNSTTQ